MAVIYILAEDQWAVLFIRSGGDEGKSLHLYIYKLNTEKITFASYCIYWFGLKQSKALQTLLWCLPTGLCLGLGRDQFFVNID